MSNNMTTAIEQAYQRQREGGINQPNCRLTITKIKMGKKIRFYSDGKLYVSIVWQRLKIRISQTQNEQKSKANKKNIVMREMKTNQKQQQQ